MYVHGQPAARGLLHFCGFDTEQMWDRGAGEVDVENANRVAGQGQGESELGCDGGFSDATFPGENLEIMLVGLKWNGSIA